MTSQPEAAGLELQLTGSGEFRRAAALADLDGDEALLAEVVGLFLDDSPRLLTEIEAAISRRERTHLARLVHTLRGVASHLAIPVVMEIATGLEALVKSEADQRRIVATLTGLKAAIRRVQPELEAVARVRGPLLDPRGPEPGKSELGFSGSACWPDQDRQSAGP